MAVEKNVFAAAVADIRWMLIWRHASDDIVRLSIVFNIFVGKWFRCGSKMILLLTSINQ